MQRYFIGDKLETVEGKIITVVEVDRSLKGSETFCGDDGRWRYDRVGDEYENGRLTSSSTYPPHKYSIKIGSPLKNPTLVMYAMMGLENTDTSNTSKGIDTRAAKKRIALELDRLYELEKLYLGR